MLDIKDVLPIVCDESGADKFELVKAVKKLVAGGAAARVALYFRHLGAAELAYKSGVAFFTALEKSAKTLDFTPLIIANEGRGIVRIELSEKTRSDGVKKEGEMLKERRKALRVDELEKGAWES